MAAGKIYFLEDEDVGLRTLEEADADGNYQNWFNDAQVCKYNSHHRFAMAKEELLAFIRSSHNSRDALILAVEKKETEAHIGNISLQNINYFDRAAEISFLFGDRENWGQGYAAKAARLLIDHAFLQLGLRRIFFGTSEANLAMQKVGEKLGFRREGVRREALFKDGRFYDIYEYGLLKEEWECGDV